MLKYPQNWGFLNDIYRWFMLKQGTDRPKVTNIDRSTVVTSFENLQENKF